MNKKQEAVLREAEEHLRIMRCPLNILRKEMYKNNGKSNRRHYRRSV